MPRRLSTASGKFREESGGCDLIQFEKQKKKKRERKNGGIIHRNNDSIRFDTYIHMHFYGCQSLKVIFLTIQFVQPTNEYLSQRFYFLKYRVIDEGFDALRNGRALIKKLIIKHGSRLEE